MDAETPEVLIEKALTALKEENAGLRMQIEEGMTEVQHMLALEDRGWTLIAGMQDKDRLHGLSLTELQDVIKFMQPKIAAGSLPGRASDLHAGYVWGRGINIEGLERRDGSQGRQKGIVDFAAKKVNRESFLSATAQQELQKARFAEGNVLFLCNKGAKTVKRISMMEITDIIVNPDFPEDIWAYQRTWNPKPDDVNSEKVSRWYYTNRFSGERGKSIPNGDGTFTLVDQDVTIIDGRFNRQVGFALGVPDGLAGIHWSEAYGEHLRYGQIVTEALSKILFKIKNNSKKGAANAAAKVALAKGAGNAASMGGDQDIEAIRTAGNAYSFEKLRPVAAMAASAWNVSNADLLNDSAAAGSSYGALQALAPGNRNAMTLMQREWVDLFTEIFEFFGFNAPKIWFEPIEAPDVYRQSQALKLLSTELTPAELRSKALDILDIAGNPEVSNTLRAQGIADAKAAAQQASPDQGQGNGTGGQSSAQKSDLRSDGIGEAFFAMQLDEFRELVERAESIARRLNESN